MATSKETRVRVEALSKIKPMHFPARERSRNPFLHLFFKARLLFKRAATSPAVKSVSRRKFLLVLFISTPRPILGGERWEVRVDRGAFTTPNSQLSTLNSQ
jgi:hypothetical protein